ncbi:MAG: aldo/keto reductase [Rhodobacteraceae bacterium]|nr:aldo/keto reductase [Paracoccaceae bacterium]
MKMNPLGQSGLSVSELALGSMTWGTQTPEDEAHVQIDMALERGVNIIDTAEMYPVNPLSKETQGDTERVIGNWVAANKARRGEVLLATKVSGSGYMAVRDGAPISRATITEAFNNSLASLQTDYIDLYQLHWPNRGSYMFRQNWTFDARNQAGGKVELHDHIGEVLETLDDLVRAGKLRAIGLSNESAWGTSQWLRIAEERGLPRMASVQNEYSLMCRHYDLDLGELSVHEGVGLLAFSPLATGLLSGKYLGDATPEGSRRSFVSNLGGRVIDTMWPAMEAYVGVARKHGLDPCQMALAWCGTRPFMASAIFGATRVEQLDVALGAADMTLSDEVMADLQAVFRKHPMPY